MANGLQLYIKCRIHDFEACSFSSLCVVQVMSGYALQRRLQNAGVTVSSLNPRLVSKVCSIGAWDMISRCFDYRWIQKFSEVVKI